MVLKSKKPNKHTLFLTLAGKNGMHKVNTEGALFTYVKNGKLHGIVVSHVDDLLLAGDEEFKMDIESKLKVHFKLSKIETGSFNYCGCRIIMLENGDIQLDQYNTIRPNRSIIIQLDMSTVGEDLGASLAELKKYVGKLVVQMNGDMLLLQRAYKRKSSSGRKLEGKEAEIELRVREHQSSLETVLQTLENDPEHGKVKGVDKMMKMILTTIETTKIMMESSEGFKEISE